MTDRVFVDSSVLLYLYSADEPEKKRRAEATVTRGISWTSTQVMTELVGVLRSRFDVNYREILGVVQELNRALRIARVTTDTIQQGLILAKRYHYGFSDALALATALEQNCTLIYSENLHSGQRIEKQLTIHNPFVGVNRRGGAAPRPRSDRSDADLTEPSEPSEPS